MATLEEYAQQHFPQHRHEGRNADAPLHPHTTVAHVVGRSRTEVVERELRRQYGGGGGDRVGVVLVRPTSDPTVVPTDAEDPEGIVDLPAKRVAASSIAAGLAVGLAVGVILAIVTDTIVIGVICGVFAALLAAWVGGMFGGGGRFAGERAWEQPHEPDRTIGIVAVYLDDERAATAAANRLSELAADDVRVVNEVGAWHLPNT